MSPKMPSRKLSACWTHLGWSYHRLHSGSSQLINLNSTSKMRMHFAYAMRCQEHGWKPSKLTIIDILDEKKIYCTRVDMETIQQFFVMVWVLCIGDFFLLKGVKVMNSTQHFLVRGFWSYWSTLRGGGFNAALPSLELIVFPWKLMVGRWWN